MNNALTKCKLLMTKGNWEAPTPQEAKIIALEVKIQKMTGGGKSKRKGDKGGKYGKKKQQKEKPKWMFQHPKDEVLKKPRKWNGIKWWYCSPDTGGKCQEKTESTNPVNANHLNRKVKVVPKRELGEMMIR